MDRKRLTKRDYFQLLLDLVNNSNLKEKNELNYFIQSQTAGVNKKAKRAKERLEEKKAEGDELKEIILEALTEKFQTIAEIMNQIDIPEATKGRVTARLSQLVNEELAIKKVAKTFEGKEIRKYKLAP